MSTAFPPIPQLEIRAMPVTVARIPADTNNYATASHAAAVVTLAGVASQSHKVYGLVVSYYGGTPASGSITIADSLINNGSPATIFSVDLPNVAGVYFIPLEWIGGTKGADMTITLADGGSGIVGKVNVIGHKMESC